MPLPCLKRYMWCAKFSKSLVHLEIPRGSYDIFFKAKSFEIKSFMCLFRKGRVDKRPSFTANGVGGGRSQ